MIAVSVPTSPGNCTTDRPVDWAKAAPSLPFNYLMPRPVKGLRRRLVADHEARILELAETCCWTLEGRHLGKDKMSRYLHLSHPCGDSITIRISDHLPVSPLVRERKMLLHIPGFRGSLGRVCCYLVNPRVPAEGGAA